VRVDQRVPLITGRGEQLTVGVLGPLQVAVDGRPIDLTTGRLRAVLAVLAMSAGKIVTVDRLATALWADDPPDNARRAVQTYLARLRGALGASLIESSAAGYLLQTEPDRVDALRFIGLLDAAADAADVPSQQSLLQQALSLWRGAPFEGVQSNWLEQHEAPRLLERYLTAIERRVDLDIADGRHAELVPQLRELTAQQPLRESLWARLLVVLDWSGRRAEALRRYETIRQVLADELGTDPGPELREIHAELLAGRRRPRPAAVVTPSPPVPPRQLPADVDGFAGQEAELRTLDDLMMSDSGDRAARSVVIAAITGTAGVGKTTLAVHWGHQVAHRFPDGQLYVNLRGYHPSGAMEPAVAIRGFLDSLGVVAQRVPSDVDGQVALYRSMTAQRRMLILLDNARDADQVRPLLPGSPGAFVLVTSRSQLTSLVAAEAAHPVALDLLTGDEARQLLDRRLGGGRVATEADATDEIVACCVGLPLALAIAAARAVTRPHLPLRHVAAELRYARSGLDMFTAGDLTTDVRSVFSWSYRTLSPAAARLFRLFGRYPGPDSSRSAAASLLGVPAAQILRPLAELCDAHLLAEHGPDRYTGHDLLRGYAAELADAHESVQEQRTALHRVLDHLLHTAHAAALQISPRRDAIELTPPRPGVTVTTMPDHATALVWFTVEHETLLAAVGRAVEAGFDSHAWQISWTLDSYMERRGHWREWSRIKRTALEAARRQGDRTGQALTHRATAGAHTRLGEWNDARAHLRAALELYEQLGDLAGQASTHTNLSQVYGREGRHHEALRHSEQALDLCRAAGYVVGQARALNAVGWDHAHLGNYEQALSHCQQALDLHRGLGSRSGEAATWDSLGYVHHHLGDYPGAVRCYEEALNLFRELGSRHMRVETLLHLADTHLAAGDPTAAEIARQRASAIQKELGLPGAADPE
jgi:DNA-binding SARP family transcriptional activator/tetratricopeptide (TPR) repeat protein